jgi:hypothetical protein
VRTYNVLNVLQNSDGVNKYLPKDIFFFIKNPSFVLFYSKRENWATLCVRQYKLLTKHDLMRYKYNIVKNCSLLVVKQKHIKKEDEMADEMTEEEIIEKLSQMHKDNSTNPAVLCSGNFRDFTEEHFQECEELRGKLFMICHSRGDNWTKVDLGLT